MRASSSVERQSSAKSPIGKSQGPRTKMQHWSQRGKIFLMILAFTIASCVTVAVVGAAAWYVLKRDVAATPTSAAATAVPAAKAQSTSVSHATRVRTTDGMEMVYVPGGTFQMGSTEGEDNEIPMHNVTLDSFWIDKTELTNAKFAVYLNAEDNLVEGGEAWMDIEDQGSLIELAGGQYRPGDGYADHPVAGVSWHGARSYCDWAGGRLPTEAEWEYAARGPNGNTYPWGDEEPTCDLAQYHECSGRTAPVGSLPDGASWVGALDMAGNVWEWVADRYGEYPSTAQTNPVGPHIGDYRVQRGGSWSPFDFGVRSAYRVGDAPVSWTSYSGFRCVVSDASSP
jgi:serine/threonine-protein kinase